MSAGLPSDRTGIEGCADGEGGRADRLDGMPPAQVRCAE